MAADGVAHQLVTDNVHHNMPDPIPVLVLGRLAIDREAQCIKLGEALLQDALNWALLVSQNTGSCLECVGERVL